MAAGNDWVYKPEEEILLVPTMSALASEQNFLSNLKYLSDFDLRHLSKSKQTNRGKKGEKKEKKTPPFL